MSTVSDTCQDVAALRTDLMVSMRRHLAQGTLENVLATVARMEDDPMGAAPVIESTSTPITCCGSGWMPFGLKYSMGSAGHDTVTPCTSQ